MTLGVAKVGEGEREFNQHLPTAKSGGVLRLCHRRNHHGYALAEGMEGCIVGSVCVLGYGWKRLDFDIF